LPAAPPGSDLDGILRQVSHAQNNQDRGSKGPWPDFDTSDLMARAGLGGGGGSTMKTMSAIFRDGVCPVADEVTMKMMMGQCERVCADAFVDCVVN